MKNANEAMVARGVAAGTLMGVAIGLIIALFSVANPGLAALLIR